MSPAPALRRAGRADTCALSEIRREAIQSLAAATLGREQARRWANASADTRVEQAIEQHEVWVAESDGVALGWVEVDRDRVERLYVHPDHSGRGIGSALLVHAEARVESAGHNAVSLEASANAEAFYRRRGYETLAGGSADAGRPMRKRLGFARMGAEARMPLPRSRMHAGEFDIDGALVKRLLAAQFPQWSDLRVEAVESAGTDNAIYRLGDDLALRLPRIHWAVEPVAKEHAWLPRLAPQLPLAIPVPVAKGRPAEGYPWHWSVYRWLDGQNAADRIDDPVRAAAALAGFVSALRRIDAAQGPPAGSHNFFRGVPLAARDAQTRAALAALRDVIDVPAATAAWEAALAAPAWSGAPLWIHGDLQHGNLLAVDGELSAVIDFDGLGVGDPACDLIVAWNFLRGRAREVFRAALEVDDASWARGRGWALSTALVGLPYYRDTNPSFVRDAHRTITEVLAEHDRPDRSTLPS